MARTVLLVCGHATVNGHAFCTGLRRLNLPTRHDAGLRARISSLTYLINAATLRPRYKPGSLGGATLPELIDLYHDRDAKIPLDKIFALLSMASDAPARETFRPKYNLSWEELFHQLTTYCLGSLVSVTFQATGRACIEGEGTVIGTIDSVEQSSDRYNSFQVDVRFQETVHASQFRDLYGTRWTLQRTAKTIEKGDAICLMQGTSRPMLVRASGEYFLIINVAMSIQGSEQSVGQLQKIARTWEGRAAPGANLTFYLKWDWLESLSSQDISLEVRQHLPSPLDEVKKRYQIGRYLIIVGELDGARSALSALQAYDETLGRENSYLTASQNLIALTYKQEGHHDKAIDEFSRLIRERKASQGPRHPSTLESMAGLALTYVEICGFTRWDDLVMKRAVSDAKKGLSLTQHAAVLIVQSGHIDLLQTILEMSGQELLMTNDLIRQIKHYGRHKMEMMDFILEQYKRDQKLDDGCILATILSFDEEQLKFLFEEHGSRMRLTSKVMQTVLEHGRHRKRTLKMLLNFREPLDSLTDSMIIGAIGNPWFGKEEVQLIIDEWSKPLDITDDLLFTILGNEEHGPEILEALLSRQNCDVQVTEYGLEEVARCEVNGALVLKKLWRRLGSEEHAQMSVERGSTRFSTEREGRNITENIIKAAVSNQSQGADLTAFLLPETQCSITTDILEAAASNPYSGFVVLGLLIDYMGNKFRVTNSLCKRAAQNPSRGYAIMVLLLNQPRARISPALDVVEIIETAVTNTGIASSLLKILFDWMGNKYPVTDKALNQCASLGDARIMRALITKLGDSFTVTDEMWIGMASNEKHRGDMLGLFLKHQKQDLDISEAALQKLIPRLDTQAIESVLRRLAPNTIITQGLAQSLSWNFQGAWEDCIQHDVNITDEAATYLLQRYGKRQLADVSMRLGHKLANVERYIDGPAYSRNAEIVMTDALSRVLGDTRLMESALGDAARSQELDRFPVLVELWPQGTPFPDWIARQAAGSFPYSQRKVELILRQSEGAMSPAKLQHLLEAAARHGNAETFEYLLNELGDDNQLTHIVVEAAASATLPQVLSIIKHKRPQDLAITDNLIMAIGHSEVLVWLVDSFGSALPINSRLLRSIKSVDLKKKRTRAGLLRHALDKCRLEVPIPEDTLVELALLFDENGVDLFLDRVGGCSRLTKRIVKASAASELRLYQVLWSFLSRLKDDTVLDEDAVIEVAKRYDEDVMAYLFHRWGETLTITENIIQAVSSNVKHAKGITTLLLDRADKGLLSVERKLIETHLDAHIQVGIDTRVLNREVLSALNKRGDIMVLTSLFDQLGDEAQVTEEIMVKAAGRSDPDVQRAILARVLENIEITGAIVEAASHSGDKGFRFLKRCLFKIYQSHGTIPVTDEALFQAARWLDSNVMRLILDLSGKKVHDLRSLFEAASQNKEHCEPMVELLLTRASPSQITDEEVTQLATSISADLMLTVLARLKSSISISDQATERAAVNQYGPSVVKLFFSHRRSDVVVTAKMIEAAVASPHAVEVLNFFCERGAQRTQMNEDIMKAAAANPKSESIMTFITDRWGASVPITEAVMKAAVRNKHVSGLMWLIRRFGSSLPITDEVLEAAVQASEDIEGQHPVIFLLRLRGENMPVTEETAKAVVQVNHPRFRTTLEELLESQMNLPITESVFRAAVEKGNEGEVLRHIYRQRGNVMIPKETLLEVSVQSKNWKDCLRLVLAEISGGYDRPFPDGILQGAVGGNNGAQVLHYMCEQWGDEVRLTEEVVSSAAAGKDAANAIRFISLQWGKGIPMTENVIEAAAGNHHDDKALEVIVQEYGNGVPITDAVIKAAAGNRKGKGSLQFMVDYWGKKALPITEQVVETAARNSKGKEVLLLMIWRWGTDLPITDAVLKAARENPKLRDIVALIAERWGEDRFMMRQ